MLNTTFPSSNFSPDAVDNGMVEKPAEELPKPQSPGASPESSSPKLTSPEPTPSPTPVPLPTPVPTPVPTPDLNQAPTTSPAPSNGNGGGGGGAPAPTIPGVPTDVVVTANTGTVDVSWTVPASNGGAAITSYDIECAEVLITRRRLLTNPCSQPDRRRRLMGETGRRLMGETGRRLLTPAAPTIATVSASVCTGNACISTGMTGLAGGLAYTCKVLARNSVGPSAYSVDSCHVYMPAVPFPPSDVELTLNTGTSGAINVAWTPQFDGGSPVISFTVECTPETIGKRKLLTEPPIISTGVNPICSGGICNTVMTGMTAGSAYSCKVLAVNIVGPSDYSSDSCSLYIPTVPDAPTIGVFSANQGCAGTVDVAWTAPAYNGGAAITSYDIHCTLTPTRRRKLLLNPLINVPASVCSGSSCVVSGMTGLDGGFAYACSVRAVNSVGPSVYSSASIEFFLPIAAPGVPTIGVFSASTSIAEAVDGAWTAPDCDGGSPITAYEIECTVNDNKRRRLLDGNVIYNVPASVCTGNACISTGMGGLAAGSTYSCKVLAINSVGPSAYSSASAPFLIPICGIGKYLSGAECVDCSSATVGYYISQPCFDTFDTVFSECTVRFATRT